MAIVVYTIEEIAKGIIFAKGVYEGFSLDELQPNQLVECIKLANQPTHSRDEWSGCCC